MPVDETLKPVSIRWKQFIRKQRRLAAGVAAVLITTLANQNSFGHGELLIRIADATRKIEAATNNLAPLYLARGELYREDQNWAAAQADYDRAEQLDPKLSSIDFYRAQLLSDSGQLQESRAMFDKALARSPKNGEGYISRAQVLVKLHETDAAIADYFRGLNLLESPKQEYFLELAQTLKASGNSQEALRVLDRGIKKFGPTTPLQSSAVDLEVETRNLNAAVTRLDTIIERAERKETWLARRGDILVTAGRTAEARKSYEDSLAAIRGLPMVLQKAAPMKNLESKVNVGLEKARSQTSGKNAEKF